MQRKTYCENCCPGKNGIGHSEKVTTNFLEMGIHVPDLGFKSIRVLQGSKMLRNQSKLSPISKLRSLLNMGLLMRTLKIQNKPSLVPCGISEIGVLVGNRGFTKKWSTRIAMIIMFIFKKTFQV